MTKKLYIFIFNFLLVSLIFSAASILAQTEVNLLPPGLTPDSHFYFLEDFFEKIGTFFTFGDAAKAERYAKLAAERVAEAKAVVDKGKPEAVKKALVKYQEYLEKSLKKTEKIQSKRKSAAKIAEIISQATSKHLSVLEELSEKVPKNSKIAIFRAKDASKNGQIKALEVLSKEKPERAAELNIQAIQNRLKKIKRKIKEGDEQNIEKTITDLLDFQDLLEKKSREHKMIVARLAGENMIKQIEDLDEIENKARGISSQIVEKVRAVKAKVVDKQINILRSLTEVNPEKAVEVFEEVSEKKLDKIKQFAVNKDAEETKETIEEFEKYAVFGQEISKIAQVIGKDATTVDQLVTKAITHHLKVLNDVYNKVPEQAREAIQKAMTVSEIGRQQIIKKLKSKKEDKIPEIAPLPSKVKEKVFEEFRNQKKYCKDLCGDGICQEMVCMEVGCPCSETPQTCPQDCAVNLKVKEEENPETKKIRKKETKKIKKPKIETPEIFLVQPN